MDWGNAAQIGSVIIAALALSISVWNARRDRAAKFETKIGDAICKVEVKFDERMAKGDAKVERLEDKVASIEGEIKHLPDKDTAHRMEMAIARLEGKFETMDERLKPVAAMATRMQDYFVEKAS